MILLSPTAPGDYTSLGAGATITFPAGTTRMGFDITIINDNMSEQNEPFTAMLGSDSRPDTSQSDYRLTKPNHSGDCG